MLASLSSTYAPIPTGTPDGTKYLRDDNTWQPPAGGGTGDVVLVLWDETTASYPARSATAPMAIWRGPADPRLIAESGFLTNVDLWAVNAMDAEAPTAVTNLTATPAETSVVLSWTAATDDVAVTGYEYRIGAGSWVDAGTGTTETVTALTADTAYTFGVRAYDAAGNKGPEVTVATATTGTGDTTPPTWTATFTMGTPTETSVVATASALAADDTAVTGYEVSYNDGSTYAAITPAGSDFTLAGTAGTTYATTKLRAKDAAGNYSTALSVPSYTMAASADTTDPTAGTLSVTPGSTTADLSVSGATDETALHAAPYAFSSDNGATYTAYQAAATYQFTGLTASTSYTFRHKVRDAAGNETVGTAVTEPTTAGGTFSPDDIAGLAMWLAADEITGLSDGATVATWEDLTANNNDASTTSASKPTYETSEIGTLPGVAFTASGGLELNTALVRNKAAVTLFIAAKVTTSTNAFGNFFFSSRPTVPTSSILQVYRDNTKLGIGGRRLDTDTVQSATSATGTLPIGEPVIISALADWQNTTIRGWVDGVQALEKTDFQTPGNSQDSLAMLASLGNSSTNDGSTSSKSFIGEVLLYQSALSTADRQAVEAYLAAKWGVV